MKKTLIPPGWQARYVGPIPEYYFKLGSPYEIRRDYGSWVIANLGRCERGANGSVRRFKYAGAAARAADKLETHKR